MKCDFMILGAAKCATSSLADILKQHPSVCFSNPKEPHFFNLEQDWRSRLDQYHDLFHDKSATLYGEGTTSYTKFPLFKNRIYKDLHEYNPDLKFIYAIRHPVERAISHYMHIYERRIIDHNFQEALRQSDVINTGRYYTQLYPYFKLFGRERFFIYCFEDFIKDQKKIVLEIGKFLGLSNDQWTLDNAKHSNKSVGGKKLGRQLERFKTPAIRKIWDQKLPEGLKNIIYNTLSKASSRPFAEKVKLENDVQEIILELNRLDILEMEKILERDLTFYLTTLDGSICVR